MKKLIAILTLAAVAATLAGAAYHNPGVQYWATGTSTLNVDTGRPIGKVRIVAYDNDVQFIPLPKWDDSRPAAALGDTTTLSAGNFYTMSLDEYATGFQVLRNGGTTAVWASWGKN